MFSAEVRIVACRLALRCGLISVPVEIASSSPSVVCLML
jgi:hypothetical protein